MELLSEDCSTCICNNIRYIDCVALFCVPGLKKIPSVHIPLFIRCGSMHEVTKDTIGSCL